MACSSKYVLASSDRQDLPRRHHEVIPSGLRGFLGDASALFRCEVCGSSTPTLGLLRGGRVERARAVWAANPEWHVLFGEDVRDCDAGVVRAWHWLASQERRQEPQAWPAPLRLVATFAGCLDFQKAVTADENRLAIAGVGAEFGLSDCATASEAGFKAHVHHLCDRV